MDKLPHLPTLADWEAIKEDATAFAVWRQTIEERVNRLEKRMCRMEKEGKARNTPRPDKRERRIDRMGSQAV